MTGPDSDDDLTAALRRDLTGAAVPYDDDRADAMIRAATATHPNGARSWQAPLAAAAAVLVIGGGAAVIATNRNGSSRPAGDGPGGCPSASTSTGVDFASALAPSSGETTATPSSTVTPSRSSTYVPAQPATSTPAPHSTAPDSSVPNTPTEVPSSSVAPSPLPTLDSVSPCAPSSAPKTSAPGTASTSAAYPLPPSRTATSPVYSASASPAREYASIVIKAGPGEQVRSNPLKLPSIGGSTPYGLVLDELSGHDGTVTATQGSRQIFVHDLSELTTGPVQGRIAALPASGQDPVDFTVNCTGTTECSVRVFVGLYTTIAPATATPSR